MAKIDTIYTKYPFFGARQIKYQIKRWYDLTISRKLVGKLMKVMGIEAINVLIPVSHIQTIKFFPTCYDTLQPVIRTTSGGSTSPTLESTELGLT
jgi:hypothetical protein